MKFRMTPVAAALTAMFAVPSIAMAEDAPAATPAVESAPAAAEPAAAPVEAEKVQLPAVKVQDRQVNEYKVETLQSPKYVKPLLDTPQNITVISKKVIEDQNVLTLRDILGNVPGITFGAGEGGGGYGDSISIRGYAGSNDVTVDGVRDSGQYTRSDPFNLESVEVVKGANSANSGAGAVGGNINLVSKTPKAERFTRVSLGLGSDSYDRATIDTNQPVSDSIALRLNAMKHENDVPGRDVEKFDRWGIAPSVAFGLGGDTQFSLALFHQEDDNTPQYGVLFRNNRKVPGVDRNNYYGYSNIDVQQIENSTATGILDHKFSDALSLRNLTRVGRTTQFLVVDPPQGNVCVEVGQRPLGATSGNECTAVGYTPSGPRGNIRDTTNEIVSNQTDLTWRTTLGGMSNALVTGVQVTRETFELTGGNKLRNANGSPATLPVMDIYDPDNLYTGPVNYFRTSKSEGEQKNLAVYAFDTLDLTKQWALTAGLRVERNEGSSTAYTVKTYTAPNDNNPTPDNSNLGSITAKGDPAENEDTLFSYRAGVVYKPVETASIYVNYGNSETPSKASVNGSCTPVTNPPPTPPQSNANCNVDPEEAVSYEIGAKWDLFDARLQLTGAIFRIERTNYRVASVDPTEPEQQLDGESRVKGFELGATGLITQKWAVFGSYAYLDSEVKQNLADGATAIDTQKGKDLPNTPRNGFNLWTTYKLPLRLEVGYGAQYQGSVLPNNSAAAPNDVRVDGYWVHKASLGWQANRNFNLRLNLNNLTDEEYYTRVRGTGWATPGEGRQAVVTANYEF